MNDPSGASWSRFAEQAPEFAQRVEARLTANLHHVLATIRPSGAPRLNGSEVHVADGEVTLGMMTGSHKLADVHRDARVEIHTAPLEDDLANGDAKLWGRLISTGAVVPDDESGDGAAPEGTMFRLELSGVSLVRIEGDELVLSTWTPDVGEREIRRR
ncbi:MAG: pyridoxamine 5'-phosphate oxidase family protein [Actinomycetota bacterium]